MSASIRAIRSRAPSYAQSACLRQHWLLTAIVAIAESPDGEIYFVETPPYGEERDCISNRWDSSVRRLKMIDDVRHVETVVGPSCNFDNQDRLLSQGAATYSHNASGQLQQKVQGGHTTSYDYDIFGNLRSVTLPSGGVVSYVVDGANRRVAKRVNGVVVRRWLYQNELQIAAQLDANGAVEARFIYALRPNVPEYMVKGAVTYRFVTDHLGSVRLVVDSSTGQVAQRIDYDAWGKVTSDSNPGFQPFGYAGGIYDHDTGLVRFGARDYDAETGRWTAKDPIRFDGGTSNLYAYVGGNPLSYVDPTGEVAWVAAGAGIGAFVNVAATVAYNAASGQSTSWQQVGAAAVSGAIAGAYGALAGPVGGTVARMLGSKANGALGLAGNTAFSAAGGYTGQVAANGIDPCHASNPLNSALWAGVGGGFAGALFKTPGLYTVKQANRFGPSTWSGVNNSAAAGAYGAASGVGAASVFGWPF